MTVCDCTDNPQISAHCICHSAAEAIRALSSIRLALADVYTPAGVRVWMHAVNARLDGKSPMQLVMAGRGQDAVDEARHVAHMAGAR